MTSHVIRGGVLACAFALATLSLSDPAAAQNGASAAETERARELYRAGDKAFKEGRYEDARTAFVAAWTFKKNPLLAAALGDTELRTKRYRDAAEHLSYALREGGASIDEARVQAIRKALADAKTHVGELRLSVQPGGADVSVDGTLIGASPLPDSVFLEPGSHVVDAKKVGWVAKREQVVARAGGSSTLQITLVASADAPPSATSGSDAPSGMAPAPPPTALPIEQSEGGKSVPLIVAGASLSAVSIGVGIALLAASGGAASDRDDQLAKLEAQEASPCGPGTRFVDGCAEIESLDGDAGTLGLGGGIALGVGAALGIATVVYTLWPAAQERDAGHRPLIVPVISPKVNQGNSPHLAGVRLHTWF